MYCHLQGTIIALASFSLGRESTSEIVSKLKAAAVLSPVAYLSNMLNEMSRVVAKTFATEVSNSLNHLVHFSKIIHSFHLETYDCNYWSDPL